jgi:hypothetical protein
MMNNIAAKIMGMLLLFTLTLPAAAMTEQQKKMMEQMDLLDQMDRMDFLETNNAARDCIRNRDFVCAEKKISQAARYMSSSRDKAELEQTRQNLASEQAQLAAEQEAARQRKLAEERARAQAEAARQQQSDFQWGKLAALATGAAIGGIDKLPSEAQTKIITGMLKDSMPGQDGISNLQNATRVNNGAAGNQGGGTGANSDEARNRAIALRCKPIGESAKPWNDPQVDTFCQQATFDKCLADSGIMNYEPERKLACSTLGNLLKSVGGNLSSCAGCR